MKNVGFFCENPLNLSEIKLFNLLMSISVVIPNYNGKDLLERNIPFLYNALKTSGIDDYEIIIADDASTDNSTEFLKKNYPEIILVQNIKNKGFSGNVNSGIDYAKKELLFILNSDVQLTKNYFKPLLKYFEMDDTFGVMGKIISLEGNEIQDTAKYPKYSYARIVTTKNYYTKNQNIVYSFILSGANSLINREKMIELGQYNELFNPYYFEDADLGLTAWRYGYKLYYEEQAVCRHSGRETVKKQPLNKVKFTVRRNRILLHYLHLNGIELFVFFLRTVFKTFFKAIMFDILYLKAFISFFKSFKKYSEYKVKYRNFKKSIGDIVRYIKKSNVQKVFFIN